jgi:hypothetical protein
LGENFVKLYPKKIRIRRLDHIQQYFIIIFGCLSTSSWWQYVFVPYFLLEQEHYWIETNATTWIYTLLTRSSPGGDGGGDGGVGVDDRTASTADDHANAGLHYACQKYTRFVDLNGSSLQKLRDTLEEELDCSVDP